MKKIFVVLSIFVILFGCSPTEKLSSGEKLEKVLIINSWECTASRCSKRLKHDNKYFDFEYSKLRDSFKVAYTQDLGENGRGVITLNISLKEEFLTAEEFSKNGDFTYTSTYSYDISTGEEVIETEDYRKADMKAFYKMMTKDMLEIVEDLLVEADLKYSDFR